MTMKVEQTTEHGVMFATGYELPNGQWVSTHAGRSVFVDRESIPRVPMRQTFIGEHLSASNDGIS